MFLDGRLLLQVGATGACIAYLTLSLIHAAAICGTTGILVTYFFVPDMTGVDLEDEDRKFMEYLEENGWTGAVGEDTDDTLSTVEKN